MDESGAIPPHPLLTGPTDRALPEETFAFYVILRRALPARLRAGTGGRREPGTDGGGDADGRPARGGDDRGGTGTARCACRGAENFPEMPRTAVPAPANLAYTSYLLATVRGGSYAEGVGAVLATGFMLASARSSLAADPQIRLTGDGLPPTAPTSTAMR